MKIPKLGMDQAVVEGTSASALRAGPGHYEGSALPGQSGNVAIAGHRTTFGGPFRQIDELDPGDAIQVTTRLGSFEYAVSEPVAMVNPEDDWVIRDQGDDRLTLTTCHPEYSASKRLVVVAHPAPAAGTPPLLPVRQSAAPVPLASRALPGESSAFLPVVRWSVAALVVVAGFSRLRPGAPVLAYALAVPAGLFTLVNLFDHLSRLLPAGI